MYLRAEEKGNVFGYKGEAKEAPAETKPYGGFQESVDMSSGGDDDKPRPMTKKTYVSRANKKLYKNLLLKLIQCSLHLQKKCQLILLKLKKWQKLGKTNTKTKNCFFR